MAIAQPTAAQSERLLRFRCELMPNAIISEFNGTESLSQPFEYTITLHNDTPLQLSNLLKQTASVSLLGHKRYFHGEIVAIASTPSPHPHFYSYTMTLAPALCYLQHTHNFRIFQQLTVLDIIDQLCAEQQIAKPSRRCLSGNYPAVDYCTQFDESDFAFIQRLLSNSGISYYFHQQTNGYQWILIDNSRSWINTNLNLLVSKHLDPDTDHLLSWLPQQRLQPGLYRARDYNYRYPQVPMETQTRLNHHPSQLMIDHYHFPGHYLNLETGTKRLQRSSCAQQIASSLVSSQSHCYSLSAGCEFIASIKNNRSRYTVVTIQHHAIDHSIVAASADKVNPQSYINHLQLLPSTTRFVSTAIAKPLAPGPCTATVTGTKEHSVHTDAMARVKIRFHWDRYHDNSIDSSCWVRCQQRFAGKNWGSVFLPRYGDEVLVDFVNADIDQPIVIGSAYNGVNQPPYDAIATPYFSGIRSRSSGSDNQHHRNEIRFNDQANHSEMALLAQRDFTHAIDNDYQSTIANNATIRVSHGDKYMDTQGQFTVQAEHSMTLASGDSHIQLNENGIAINAATISINPGSSADKEAVAS